MPASHRVRRSLRLLARPLEAPNLSAARSVRSSHTIYTVRLPESDARCRMLDARGILDGRQASSIHHPSLSQADCGIRITPCIKCGNLYSGGMSVEQIKDSIASLSPVEQSEVSAFLFHLRHASDSDYQERVASRLSDTDPDHWLTPDAFERQLDRK